MRVNGATDRWDIGGIALKVAEEFDKALCGEVTDRAVLDKFVASLAGGGSPSPPAPSMFLHNHRTIGAFSRALQRACNSRVETVDDLNARVREKVQEAERLLARPLGADDLEKEAMKRFFLSLHRELLMQQFPPRRIRRPRVDEELVHG